MLQRFGKRHGAHVSLLGLLGERPTHHREHFTGDSRIVFAQLHWFVDRAVEHRRHRLAGKCPLAREHLVGHRAEGEHVTPRIRGIPTDLLGR